MRTALGTATLRLVGTIHSRDWESVIEKGPQCFSESNLTGLHLR